MPDLEERKLAIGEYIRSADDQPAARAFVADCLDPVADSDLLTWLEEYFPPEPTTSIP